MLEGRYIFGDEDISELLHIREEVFVKEQGMLKEVDVDGKDEECIHAVAVDNQKFVATGRLYMDENIYLIGRIAVLKEYRGKAYGDFIVRLLVDKAFNFGAKEVFVESQLYAIPFYEKIGFVVCGDPFDDNGFEKVRMRLNEGSLCRACHKKA